MVARPQIVSRAGWGARAPRSRSSIRTPTARVFIHHTADDRQGAAAMRAHQNFHMDTRGWTDFAYSFAVGDNGTIFEGRGAGIAGGHTQGHNSTSHGIALLGNFERRQPPAAMLNSLAHLLAFGTQQRWWNLTIRGHREVSSTACPGRHVQSQLGSIRQRANALLGGATIQPEAGGGGEWDEMATEAQIRAVVRSEVSRAMQWLLADRNNAVYDPRQESFSWLNGAMNLPRLAAQIRSDQLRQAQYIAGGRNNAVFDPRQHAWMADAATLPQLRQLMQAARGVEEEVPDPDEYEDPGDPDYGDEEQS